jgi:succinate dehydrogenase/fumarate reductase flavoprotein subunit
VVVLERGSTFGGTTAISGGSLWIPNNRRMAEAGLVDSRDDALRYIERISLGRTSAELRETFVDECNPLVEFLERTTSIHFEANLAHPDYQPNLPGARNGGRTLQGDLFDTNRLGSFKDTIRAGYTALPLTKLELDASGKGAVKMESWDYSVIAERINKGIVGLGRALVGELMAGCLEHGAELVLGARARRLVRDGKRVVGVEFERDGAVETLEGQAGVVLATGGFEWDSDLVDAFLGAPVVGPSTPPTNDGDGLRMAIDVGAALGNMSEAWWAPTLRIPGETYEHHQMYRNSNEIRGLPGSIVVNRAGRRFANEALNYNDFAKAMQVFDPGRYDYANLPCYLVFDQQFRASYSIATLSPGDPTPSWLVEAPTLRALAERLGIESDGLEEQVASFNAAASLGNDPIFDRGQSAYDRYRGDPRIQPNANVRPLGEGPYYGLELFLGTLGTKGGPRTNARGQVLSVDGAPIHGLFAAGNVAANVFGPGYPGAGSTLGSGMTFGRLAGQAVVQVTN